MPPTNNTKTNAKNVKLGKSPAKVSLGLKDLQKPRFSTSISSLAPSRNSGTKTSSQDAYKLKGANPVLVPISRKELMKQKSCQERASNDMLLIDLTGSLPAPIANFELQNNLKHTCPTVDYLSNDLFDVEMEPLFNIAREELMFMEEPRRDSKYNSITSRAKDHNTCSEKSTVTIDLIENEDLKGLKREASRELNPKLKKVESEPKLFKNAKSETTKLKQFKRFDPKVLGYTQTNELKPVEKKSIEANKVKEYKGVGKAQLANLQEDTFHRKGQIESLKDSNGTTMTEIAAKFAETGSEQVKKDTQELTKITQFAESFKTFQKASLKFLELLPSSESEGGLQPEVQAGCILYGVKLESRIFDLIDEYVSFCSEMGEIVDQLGDKQLNE